MPGGRRATLSAMTTASAPAAGGEQAVDRHRSMAAGPVPAALDPLDGRLAAALPAHLGDRHGDPRRSSSGSCPASRADDWWDVAFAVVLVSAATIVLRPVLAALAVAMSWFGIVVIGFFAQAVIVYVGLRAVPGRPRRRLLARALLASWLYAILGALGSWLMLVDDDAALLAHVVRSAQPGWLARRRAARRKGITLPTPGADGLDGVVFVQLDGVPWPLLQLARRVGQPAHDQPVGPLGQPRDARVDRRDPLHHTGLAGRHPARQQRQHARVPLVREGLRPAAGGQPARGRGRDRAPGERRARAAGRRRLLDQQPVLRRRADQHAVDGRHVRGQARARPVPQLRLVRAAPVRLRPGLLPDHRRDPQGAAPGVAAAAGAGSSRGSTGTARTSCCAPPPTSCCATSTWRWSPSRWCSAGARSTSTSWTTTRSPTTPGRCARSRSQSLVGPGPGAGQPGAGGRRR